VTPAEPRCVIVLNMVLFTATQTPFNHTGAQMRGCTVEFPYAAPPPQEPVKTLRSLINIRKDTLRLVRCSEDLKLPGDEVAGKNRACYNIEFTFDADTQVAITIYYQAMEEFHNGVPV
ncbi:hypothetical protein XENOCAPTIV_009016, partial [Xenoophorus captivus]